jgi:hypothetical protein
MTRNLRLHLSHAALIFSGMFAGVLSSILCITKDSFQLAMPGLTLGGLLSIGISLINYSYRESLNQGKRPGLFGVLGWIVAVGTLAAFYMSFFSLTAFATVSPDVLLRLNPQAPFFALVYTFTLLPIYYVRFFVKNNSGIILLKVALGLLAGFFLLVLSIMITGHASKMDALLQMCFLVAIFKVIPFVWLWFFSVCLFDPAFTPDRWQRITGNAKADVDTTEDTI